MNVKALIATIVTGAVLVAAQGVLADMVRIGFVTTLTTPAGVIGNDMKDAVELALDHIGRKMGPHEVQVLYEDDGFKPEVGKQKTDKLVKQDDVHFVAGYIWSHVLLASRNSVLRADKFLISSNAGPHQLAGKDCHKNFFSTSWQNDQTPMALGEVLNQEGVKSIYVMAPNYAAGKDMVEGVERTFKGKVVGKDMTKWGADAQVDFSAELAKVRSSGAAALFAFYPGKAGGAFVQQFTQAGLAEKVKLYTVFTVDSLSLPKFQEGKLNGVLGSRMTQFWAPDLDNAQNRKFVSDFKKKHKRYPSFYAAQSYDTVFFIKSAVEAVGGDLKDMDGMRAAMKKADYPSVRGKYSYGNNHFPIQNFYLREVAADADGVWTTKTVKTVYTNHQDTYAKECELK